MISRTDTNSTWVKKKLSEVSLYISRGITPKYTEEKTNSVGVINQRCIRDGKVSLVEARKHDILKKKISDEKLVQNFDILVNSTGEGTLGRVSQIKSVEYPLTVDSHVTIVRGDESTIDKLYLGYSVKSQQNIIENMAEGSTGQTELSRKRLGEEIFITFPVSKNEQITIAHVLSTLDDKIEVNNLINKNLEDMAQAIFKRWFVDYEFPNEEGEPYKSSGGEMVESELGMIPKGWSVKTIRDIPVLVTDFVANGSFKSLKDNVNILDSPNYAVFMRNTDLKANFSSGMKYVDKHSYDFLSKSKLFGGEVIISNVGDVGSVYLCPIWNRPMTLGNNVIMMKSTINPVLNNFFYRLFLSREGQSLIDSITGGSAQPKFNKTDFRGLKIVTPPLDTLINMLKRVNVIEDILHHNKNENMRLIDMRDTLLPKLMSGEIRVPIEESLC